MNTERIYGFSLFDFPESAPPRRRPWLAALLLVLAGLVLAGPHEDSAATARFRVLRDEVRQLDSLGLYHDSLGRALRTQASGVWGAANRQLNRDLAIQPGDTLRPDGTVMRGKGSQK